LAVCNCCCCAGAILAGGFGIGGAGALAHPRLHAIADAWTLHALIPNLR
jgi:hypothetical protein